MPCEQSMTMMTSTRDDVKSLGVAFNKLRRTTRDLETSFEKYSIPTK